MSLATNRARPLFLKGDLLPLRKTETFQTVVPLRRNEPYHETDNVIRIPLIEGDNAIADRNRQILAMEIKPDNPRVKRDVPAGSDIDVTVVIDESRRTTVKAFIPILDEEFGEECIVFRFDLADAKGLLGEMERQKTRLEEVRRKAEAMQDRNALGTLHQIDQEQVVDHITRDVLAAQGDPGALGEADKKLRDFTALNDSVEDALEWPGLVRDAREQLQSAGEAVQAHGEPEERERLKQLAGEIEQALAQKRTGLLRTRIEDVRDLYWCVTLRQPEFWVRYLQYLEDQKGHMRDQAAAARLFAQGRRAIQAEPLDFEALKAAVRQLIGLLPPGPEREAAEARGRFGSTIIKQ